MQAIGTVYPHFTGSSNLRAPLARPPAAPATDFERNLMLTDTVEVTDVFHITTKTDMSRWTRAHAETPGLTWTVQPAPGGTMLITEHRADRRALPAPDRPSFVSGPGGGTGRAASPAGGVASWAV